MNEVKKRVIKDMPRISDTKTSVQLTEQDLIPNYLNLRNAIVLMAITDLSQAYREQSKNESARIKLINDCESFFRSELFESLFSVSGEYLIKMCKEEEYHNDFVTRHSVLDLP